ncbi:MAG: ribbon-helix-helix domain-containing protein [Desulfatiglandales bacterium]
MLLDGQNEKLAYLAKRLKTSKSKLIREAIDLLIMEMIPESADPLLELIGQAEEVGMADISEHHDQVLSQMEKQQWSKEKSS